jgi:capsular exopolysaccharide synthesis family protein
MKKEVIVQKDPKSPISEIFKTLRTNIQFMNTNKKLKTLLVTSTTPGEGKSYVAANLSVTFAQAGKKVILIDADMRKGRQYNIFDVSPRPGLSNYLSGVNENGEEEPDITRFIQPTEVDNLLIIPAGNIPPNPSELLVSPQMIQLLEELKEVCDIVIIDGTPSELVSDSIILSRIVDSTIIVAASKETKKDSLERVVKNIQNVGGKIAGVVLNKVEISARKYQETYYYGSTALMPKKNAKVTRTPKNAEELKRRASSSISQNMPKPEKPERKEASYLETNPLPSFLEKKEEIKPKEIADKPKLDDQSGISIDKTNDILDQINSYLEQEKKNLN